MHLFRPSWIRSGKGPPSPPGTNQWPGRDSNPHTFWVRDFESRASAIPPPGRLRSDDTRSVPRGQPSTGRHAADRAGSLLQAERRTVAGGLLGGLGLRAARLGLEGRAVGAAGRLVGVVGVVVNIARG